MSENEIKPEDPKIVLAEIRQGLDDAKVEERLKSLNALRQLPYGSHVILRQLEKMAVTDRSKRVREAIWNLLDSTLYRQIQARSTTLSLQTRQIIADEIFQWGEDGLISDVQTQTLRQRYAFDLVLAPAKEASAQPQKEKQTLAQTLLSGTSIKIALYLGAFFVISAAMIFAAAIETLRLPLLLFFTLGFGGASFLLKKKLSQPSFTLFIVFSVLLPIDFSVLSDLLNLKDIANPLYWMGVFALMAFIWAFAIFFFRSRFFSLLAFLSLGISLLFFADLFGDPPVDFYLLMLTFSGLIALAGVRFLSKWQDEKFSMPLFLLVQFQEIILLFVSAIAFLIHYDEGAFFANSWWLVISAIWFLAAVFYIFSHSLKKKFPFHYLAVASILPLTWVFLNTFDANNTVQMVTLFMWGAIFAGSGEWLRNLHNEKFQIYGQPALYGSVPLIGIASFWCWDESRPLGFAILIGGTIIYTLITFYRSRQWTWAFALLFALTTYLAFFELKGIRSWDVYFGFKLFLPSLLFLLPDIFLKNDLKALPDWRSPPRAWGLSLVLINTFGVLTFAQNDTWRVALTLSFYAFLALVYAIRYFSQVAYLANAYFALALIFILHSQNVAHWLVPLITLAVIYYLIGLGLERVKKGSRWVTIYRYSGLFLGTFVALSAPFDNARLAASLPVVIAAMLITFEAFKKRNIWLGFPANALYLMAYFMILINFEIDQPQFFSVVAAALGMLMHYLLMRSGSKTATFITGMLSQLVLLSITYFQMVSEEKLIYFVVLFFQALVVLIYGIVVRAKSLVITPIIFLVVGVLTITFGLLEGLPTILLIGCTGVFLISFGIGALLLREQVADLREKLDDWNA